MMKNKQRNDVVIHDYIMRFKGSPLPYTKKLYLPNSISDYNNNGIIKRPFQLHIFFIFHFFSS